MKQGRKHGMKVSKTGETFVVGRRWSSLTNLPQLWSSSVKYTSVATVAAAFVLALAPATSASAAQATIEVNSAKAENHAFINPIEVEVTYSCESGTEAKIALVAGGKDVDGVGNQWAQCSGKTRTTTVGVSPVLDPVSQTIGSFSQGDTITVSGALVTEMSAENNDGQIAEVRKTLTVQ